MPYRVVLAVLSSSLAALVSPFLLGGAGMALFAASSAGLELPAPVEVAAMLLLAAMGCGTIALGVARAGLKHPWIASAREMAVPFGVVALVGGAAWLALLLSFRAYALRPESSPYLATAMMGGGMCALSATGASALSALLGWRREAGR